MNKGLKYLSWKLNQLLLHFFTPFAYLFGVFYNFIFSCFYFIELSLLLFLFTHFTQLLSFLNFFLFKLFQLSSQSFFLLCSFLFFLPWQFQPMIVNFGPITVNTQFPATLALIHACSKGWIIGFMLLYVAETFKLFHQQLIINKQIITDYNYKHLALLKHIFLNHFLCQIGIHVFHKIQKYVNKFGQYIINIFIFMIEYPTNNSFLIGILLLCTVICTAPQQQLMKLIPGYPSEYSKTHRAWSGYLDTGSSQRSLHYIFMQNLKDGEDNKLPVVLWLNGGPGCSSKLGFLQQIAPYYMDDGVPYKPDTDLKNNSFSWLNLTNLLFIDSPAGVGYSINSDKNYKYNDVNTAKDNIIALANFFKKFEGYRKNYLILSGQSYAGKYIPDLAVAIDNYNTANPSLAMNLKGLLIGNPVIDLESGSLQKSQKYFMIEHNLIDKKLTETYERSCLKDLQSAGCQYFNTRYDDLLKYVDPYNIYGPCYDPNQNKNSQQQFVLTASKFFSSSSNQTQQANRIRKTQILNNFFGCFYGKGINDYFTLPSNIQAFNSKKSSFQICNGEIFASYQQTPSGSINQLTRIINQNSLKVALFSGDWDGVVPLLDTLKNMDKLSLRQQGKSMQWSVNGQHAGFIRIYSSNFKIYVIKGAGHSAPQFQRERAYDMLQKYLSQL